MTEYLFIGGTRDGERLPVPFVLDRIALPLPGPPSRKPHPLEIYVRTPYYGEGIKMEVFALQGMNGAEVLQCLVDGYCSKNQYQDKRLQGRAGTKDAPLRR